MPHQPSSAPSLEFQTKDFHHHPKNSFWYLGMAILLVAGLYVAIWLKDYLSAAVVIAAGIAIFRLANLQPSALKVRLTSKGVYWGKRFYGYHQLRAFWVAAPHQRATLYLERLNLAPAISVVIPASSLDKTLQFLGAHLPYHDHRGEPLADRFSRLLRF